MANFGDIAANTLSPSGTNAPRLAGQTNQATATPNSDTTDLFQAVGQAQAITFNAPTGTPVGGQQLRIQILDNGSAQTLTFNSAYQGSTALTLPSSSIGSTTVSMVLTFMWDQALGVAKWRLISKAN